MNNKPNLFEIATSELSQDAFITWLLKWGDSEYNSHPLNKCSCSFIRKLLNVKDDFVITSVKAGRQWNHIDVWCQVNEKYFIIIEDKKGTKEHSNQLNRYKDIIIKEFKNKSEEYIIIPVYFKMDEQSDLNNVRQAGYSIFTRKDMIEVISPFSTSNDILADFFIYLKNLDDAINSYKVRPINKWDWWSWRGYFSELQNVLDGNWDYVPNAYGGFLGFWWHWNEVNIDNHKFAVYLQLEYEKLIIKIECYDKELRNKIRADFRNVFYDVVQKHNLVFRNYGRVGNYMGVAKYCEDYRKSNENNILDWESTIKLLSKTSLLLDEVVEELNSK